MRQAVNYGYIGDSSSISSDSYTAVTVKVKVSSGATAYVYLTDTTADRAVMNFATPDYTFWYDVDGNVLKGEPDESDSNFDAVENIAYEVRSDGLYEDADGNLYANLYNLEKEYFNEGIDYFDDNGEQVNYEELESDKLYYSSSDRTAYAAHRLVTSNGNRVFEYSGTGIGKDAEYYYYVNDVPDLDYVVKTFDTDVASLRYENGISEPYFYEIGDTNGEWVTVRFLIHTGSASKSYRLELWSGERDKSGAENVTLGDTVSVIEEKNSYVVFDYSYISLDESTYTALLKQYLDGVTESYVAALRTHEGALEELNFNDYNLIDLEKIAAKYLTDEQCAQLKNYTAHYYTFTLYDTAAYYPFNEETAGDGDTDYDYSISDYSETLAYFRLNDANDYTTFVDYSPIDQSVTRTDASDDGSTDDETTSDVNYGLLISSIVLSVALLLTLAAMLVREIVASVRRKKARKHVARNTYSKRKRYIRQYTKANGDIGTTEGENPADATADTPSDTPDKTTDGSDNSDGE